MATFVAKSNTRQERYLQLTIIQEKNVADNTSTLYWELAAVGGTDAYCVNVAPTKVEIDGKTVYETKRLIYASEKIFPAKKGRTSGSIVVSHDENGEKTVDVVFDTAVYYSDASQYGGAFVLDKIKSTSTVSCTDAYIEEAPIITINASLDSVSHTLRYSFEGLTGTIVEKTSETIYEGWTIPKDFYAKIPDSPSGQATIYCDTYIGDALVGTEECIFTVTADPDRCRPTISQSDVVPLPARLLELTGGDFTAIRHCSAAPLFVSNENNKAKIVAETVTHNGITIDMLSDNLSDNIVFESVESGLFTFSVTDSRGYTTTVAKDLVAEGKFVEYVKLTCNQDYSVPDANGNMKLSCFGNYFDGSFGAVENILKVQYRYKTKGGNFNDWADMEVTTEGNTYTASVEISGLNHENIYEFETRVTDTLLAKLEETPEGSELDEDTIALLERLKKFATASSKPVASKTVFDWGHDDFKFNVPVYLQDGSLAVSQNDLMKLLTELGLITNGGE